MIKLNKPSDCCGCTACASVCSHNAITMTPDALGFLYPVVDKNKCVDCGLCEAICPFNEHYDTSLNFEVPIVYGARHKDINEVMQSRSGAVFVAISDFILDSGGVVYGVCYSSQFKIIHKRANNKVERDEFRGSKYVQSDLIGVFRNIKNDLKSGLRVLFVGTGCQVAGLKNFVGAKLGRNLFLVDIVCHGVVSPNIWRDYISYLESQRQKKIVSFNFRDKITFGWSAHRETYKYEGKDETMVSNYHLYNKIYFRKSCSSCHFCNTKRVGDVTLADFWGWQKQRVALKDDDRGLNLVLINTPKGKTLFKSVMNDLIAFEVNNDSYLQPNLKHPTPIHPFRDLMETDYIKKGFKYVFFHDYDSPTLADRVRRYIGKKLQ